MKSQKRSEIITILLGALTLILFATKPYVLDLIEPAKSVGQVIGENAKDLIESLKGKGDIDTSNSKREIWSNIITILAFILFALTIIFSSSAFQKGRNKWIGLAGTLLSAIGLGIYFSHLTIWLIAFIAIAILVVALVMYEGF